MTLRVRSWIRASCDLITCLSVSLSSVTSVHLFFSVHPYLFEYRRLPVGDEDAEEGGPVSSAARVVGWCFLRKSTSQQTVHSVSIIRVHYLRCSLWDLCCHSVNLHSKLYLYTFLFLFIHWFIWLMFDYLWSAKRPVCWEFSVEEDMVPAYTWAYAFEGKQKRSSVCAFWNTGSEGFVWHHGVWEKVLPHQTGGRGDRKHGGCDSWSDFVRWMKVWPRRVGNERSHNKLLALSAITVLSGCNKTPQTGWLINRRNLFLTVLEVEKSKIRAPAIQHLMRAHFLVCRQLSFCSVLTGQQRVKGSLRGLFHKGTYRIQEVSTLRT